MRFPFRHHERYTYIKTMDSGVLGATFLIEDQETEARFVLKMITDVIEEDFESFKLAFESLQRLHHDNLSPYEDIIFQNGYLGVVRPYLDGPMFTQYIQRPLQDAEPEEENKEDEPTLHEDEGASSGEVVGEEALSSDDPTTPLDLTSLDLERELANISADGKDDEMDDIFADIAQHTAEYKQATLATILNRLHDMLPQIASALEVLHRFKKAHGDLHPGNIRVVDGQCQLIEYGLTPLLSQPQTSDSSDITLDDLHRAMLKKYHDVAPYFAPEVILHDAYSPAADIYSLGCMLFEIITQRAAHTIFHTADHHAPIEPPSILALQPQCPSAWAEFIQEMLHPDPHMRPSVEALQDFLKDSPQTPTLLPPTFIAEPSTLSGRDELVDALTEDISAIEEAEYLPVYIIEGEAGAGKHHLSERVSYTLARSGWSIIKGIFDAQAVDPYTSWNGVVEQLTELLRHCPPALQQESQPLVEDMAVLFPTLGDGQTTQLAAVEAMRQLIGRLSMERPLLLVLSHLDRADEDSLSLLHALRAEAHPTRCVILATANQDHNLFGQYTQHNIYTHHARAFTAVESQQFLSTIAQPEEMEAFETLLEKDRAHTPLLLKELLYDHKQAEQTEAHQISNEPLHTLYLRRIKALKPKTREVLEYIALSIGPLRLDVLQHVCTTLPDETLMELTTSRLVKHTVDAQTKSTAYRVSHPIIQEVLLKLMSNSRREPRYQALAKSYDKLVGEASPHVSFEYWRHSDQTKRAIKYAHIASKEAQSRCAYHRAAEIVEWLAEHTETTDQHLQLAMLCDARGQATRAQTYYDRLIDEAKDQDRRLHIQGHKLISMLNGGLFDQARVLIEETLTANHIKFRQSTWLRGWGRFADKRKQKSWSQRHESESATDQASGLAFILEHAILAAPMIHMPSLWHIYDRLWQEKNWPADEVSPLRVQLNVLEQWLDIDHRQAKQAAQKSWQSLTEHIEKQDADPLRGYLNLLQARQAQYQGQYEDAQRFYERAQQDSTRWRHNWSWLRANILFQWGLCAVERGELEQAEALEHILRRREHHLALAQMMASLLAAHRQLANGELIMAQHELDQTQTKTVKQASAMVDLWRIRLQSKIYLAQGKSDVAVEHLKIFIESATQSGLMRFPTVAARLYLSYGQALAALHSRQHTLEEHRQKESLKLLDDVMRQLQKRTDHLPLIEHAQVMRLEARVEHLKVSDSLLRKRAHKQVLRLLDRAVMVLTPMDNPLEQARCAEARGFILQSIEDPEAKSLLNQAKHLYEHYNQHSSLYLEGWPLPDDLSALKEN